MTGQPKKPTPRQPDETDPCVWVIWSVAAIFFVLAFCGIIRLFRLLVPPELSD